MPRKGSLITILKKSGKINHKKNILVFFITFVVFSGLTYFSNTVLGAFDVTSVRFSAALPPVLTIAFGWPAALACSLGNCLCDILAHYPTSVVIMGLLPQALYGLIPMFIWRKIVKSDSHATRLDGPKSTVMFVFVMLVYAGMAGLFVGFFQFIAAGTAADYWNIAWFVLQCDINACLILGLPLMVAIDFFYSKYQHSRKRSMTVNETVIFWSCVFQGFSALLIVVYFMKTESGADTVALWNKIFTYTGTVANGTQAISAVVMCVFAYMKNKHKSLRVIEKKTGTVFVDEKNRLEFLSFPGQDLGYRVKSDFLGFGYEKARTKTQSAFDNAWYVSLSCQKGCPMKCTFCDCPGYGYYGNVTTSEFSYQMDTVLTNSGSPHTRRFEVDFSRMGEPTLNPALLDYLEFQLKAQVTEKVSADSLIPTVSTMLPRTVKNTAKDYLLRFCRIKDEVFGGKAVLNLTINTTDENARKHIFRNMALPLADVAEIADSLPVPKRRKYTLSFAVTKDTVIDAALIDRLFDKKKFLVCITPIHETFNAADDGFRITTEYTDFTVFEGFEKAFTDLGWDVIVYLDKKEEDKDALTNGNLLLPNISDKISERVQDKKRIGILVAIELGAVFEVYKKHEVLEGPDGFHILKVEKEDYIIYILRCGMGEIAASAGAQYLISKFEVGTIVNFGVVGGLTEAMGKQKVCIVDRVVHYKYDCTEFLDLKVGQVDGHDSIYLRPNENLIKNATQIIGEQLPLVTCCSGDKFVGTAEEKSYLHRTFDGDICDMESAGIVLTCEANNVPCIMFKAVSDGLSDGAAGFFAELEAASLKCLQIADKIMAKIATFES